MIQNLFPVIKLAITKCILDSSGTIIMYDFCAHSRLSYGDLEDKQAIIYLGEGIIHSIDKVLQNIDPLKPKLHFWIHNENYKPSIYSASVH